MEHGAKLMENRDSAQFVPNNPEDTKENWARRAFRNEHHRW
jgi:hypothetical protein